MSIDALREILLGLGVEDDKIGPERRLRSDLALDSTETTELELELRRQFGLRVDLWDRHDYSLAELAERIECGRALSAASSIAGTEEASTHAVPVSLPLERAAHYRRRGLWRAERVDELVLQHAAAKADKCAVIADARRLTYRELAASVHDAEASLRHLGISRGDPVIVQLPNDLELVVLVLALIKLGAPPVLTLPALREYELEAVLRVTRPEAMAVPRRLGRFDHLALARELRKRHSSLRALLVAGQDGEGEVDLVQLCAPRPTSKQAPKRDVATCTAELADTAVILLSSGITGQPKAIPRAHEGYGYMLRASAQLAGLTEESVYLAVMPATHGFVLGCPGVLGALASGGTVVLGSADDPRQALELVRRHRVTHCALVPALVTQWLAAVESGEHDTSSLRVLQVGGARLNPEPATLAQQMLGCQVQQVYGMSEGLLSFTRLNDPDEVVRLTQGRPISPEDEIRIVDDDNRMVPDGECGELLTRGPYTVAGYLLAPQANAEAFTPDGFYRTGDLVRMHPSGNLVVEGRIRDVINRGGEKISAEELEALVLEHPDIAAAAIVAMPHPVYGEAICLFATAAGSQAPELRVVRGYLEQRGVARFKLPERLEVVDALPMIGIGKINKAVLREEIVHRFKAGKAGE